MADRILESRQELQRGFEERAASLEQTQEVLSANEERFFALLDNTHDHIYFKDLESRFLLLSHSQAQRFGKDKPDDFIGKSDFDIFSDEHASLAYRDEQEIIKTGKPVINKIERETWLDGSLSWVSTSKLPLRNKAGEIVGTFGISRDITETMLLQQELEESESYGRNVLNSIQTGFFVIDVQTQEILDVNRAAEIMLGADRGAMIGQPCSKFIVVDADHPIFQENGHGLHNVEHFYRRANGTLMPVLRSSVQINRHGKPHLLDSFVDISEIREMEKSILEAKEIVEATNLELHNPSSTPTRWRARRRLPTRPRANSWPT